MTQKKLPILKSYLCPRCLSPFQVNPDEYFKCLNCGGEFWPDPLGEEGRITSRGLTTISYVSRSLPEGCKVPPGGSKQGKRPKKKGTKTYIDNGFCE